MPVMTLSLLDPVAYAGFRHALDTVAPGSASKSSVPHISRATETAASPQQMQTVLIEVG